MIDAEPLQAVFERTPNAVCRVIKATLFGELTKGKSSLDLLCGEALSSFPTFVEIT